MMKNNGWNFDNSYKRLPEFFYTSQVPSTSSNPHLVLFNQQLAEQLGLDFTKTSSENMANIFSGNLLPEGAEPISQAYAGHQFGQLNILGDGRAILMGEHLAPDGSRWDIQFKGSGRTAYSRGGDGKAALGPMLREFLISESMFYLGIPTTRSLAVVASGEKIIRNGPLPGAILTRIASSHVRVGTFELLRLSGNKELLQVLINYTIDRHYPEAKEYDNPTLEFLNSVIKKQVELITHWLRVGFIHGVMNTDNMSISGETIDYGPCAFMNTYNPSTVFSSIDRRGRYRYENQASIAQWNLARFAETLIPLLDPVEEKSISLATESINEFSKQMNKAWLSMMRKKIGLITEEEADVDLIKKLIELMERDKVDYTNTFRKLVLILLYQNESSTEESFSEEFSLWLNRWKDRLQRQSTNIDESVKLMQENNPAFIPRNHLVEEALEAATSHGDLTLFNKLLLVLANPYQEQPQYTEFQNVQENSDKCYQTFCGT